MKKRNFLHFKEDKGSATIEALISFTGFLFVIFTILSVVNVCRAQMLISNAVDTATKEITQYSYFYEMSGLSKFKADVDGNAEIGAANLNDIISTVDSFSTSIATAYDNSQENVTNITNAANEGNLNVEEIQKTILSIDSDVDDISGSIDSMSAAFGSVADNPLLYMKSIVAVAGSEFLDQAVSHAIAAPLAKAFFTKHFGENADEADAELKRLGVVNGLNGMNFKNSTMFSAEEKDEVHIVVYYKVKIMQLLDWATFEVNICKESVGRAWLGGDDVVKTVKPMEPVVESEEDDASENEQSETDENKEATDEETSEKVDTTNSYWHMSEQDKYNAVVNGQYSNEIGRDFLHYYKTINGVPYAQEATPESLKADNPKLLCKSYTIKKANDEIHNNIYLNVIGELNNIGLYLEAHDGSEKVDRNFIYEIYVPENISDSDYELLKKQIEKAEENIDLYKDAPKTENSINKNCAENVEYTISIVKAGGNYDYGSEE